jgi:hypothetical protein
LGNWIVSGVDWIGVIIMLIAWICIMVIAFQKSVLWGLGVLFFGGIVGPIFALLNWKQAGYWLMFGIVGWLITIIF